VSAAPQTHLGVAAATAPGSRQTGVTAEGTAAAVSAVLEPERGSDEEEHDLERVDQPGMGGTAAAMPPVRLHWLA
jgi:hypothetical protein